MVIGFCEEVGLPTNLLELGIEKLTEEKIMKAAEASFAEGVPEERSGAPLFFVVNFKLCYNKIRVKIRGEDRMQKVKRELPESFSEDYLQDIK